MAIVDNFTKEALEKLTKESYSYGQLLLKLGYKSTAGNTYKTVKNRLEQYNISTEHFKQYNFTKRTEENVFVENSTANQTVLRNWYEKGNYTEYKCAICGLPAEWQGKPLTLTLDHINGIHNDDRLENLRWVCPNCDRQLPTYSKGAKGLLTEEEKQEIKAIKIKHCLDCGKEISSEAIRCVECSHKQLQRVNRPSREELKAIIRSTPFTVIAKKYGVTDNAIRKWCDNYNLPRKSSDIKLISDEDWEKI